MKNKITVSLVAALLLLTGTVVYGMTNQISQAEQKQLIIDLEKSLFQKKPDLASAQKIISEGADINTFNQAGHTLLHMAIMSNRPEIVKFLVEQGADVNKLNKYNSAPITWAITGYKGERLPIAQYLIEHGADIYALDNNGKDLLYHIYDNLMDYSTYSTTTNPVFENFIFNIGKLFIEQKRFDELDKMIKTLNQYYADDINKNMRLAYAKIRQMLQQLAFAKKIGQPDVKVLYI